jgi:hypothetical protein
MRESASTKAKCFVRTHKEPEIFMRPQTVRDSRSEVKKLRERRRSRDLLVENEA